MLDRLKQFAWRNLSRAQALARSHPHRITVTVVGLFGGFAVAAFGSAQLAPDAADMPRRVVVEQVTPNDVVRQLDDLASRTLELSRSDVTRAVDSADSLLRRLGVADATAAAFIRTDRDARRLVDGRGGKMVQARAADDGTLIDLVARFPALDPAQQLTHFTRLTMARANGSFFSRLETAPLAAQVRLGNGTIRSSLFAATDEARLPQVIAGQLAEMFSTDIDFHRELSKGDSFRVMFEALSADDQPITWNEGTGRVLAAEFTNNGRTVESLWVKEGGIRSKGAYFGYDGQSKRRNILASPLEFSRMTSGFSERMDPIMNKWVEHKGVDYGAPTGTAVRSVGDGSIEFAGLQTGYGNIVQVNHGNQRSTVYAHLSRIDVKKGQHIAQGEQLGAVGATGWATGPHLHFEFRVAGVPQNPMTIVKSSEATAIAPLPKEQLAMLSRNVKAQLEIAKTLTHASGSAE